MLVLSNDDIEQVVDLGAVVDALEDAYRDLGTGAAAGVPRADLLVTHPTYGDGAVHAFKTMSGAWPRHGVTALRLNSDVVRWPDGADGRRTRQKVPSGPGGTYNGSIQLYSHETGQLLAMFPDGVLQRLRVGATNALAARHLAVPDVRTVALLGSGWQAGAQAAAVCAVLDGLEAIEVFSPTAANRERFAAELDGRLPVAVRARASAEEAVAGADIVMLATNSLEPVLVDEWVRPGLLVTTIRGPEVGDATFARFDDLVVHTREVVEGHAPPRVRDHVPEFHRGEYRHGTGASDRLAAARTLADVVADPSLGRRRVDDAVLFHNFCGLGLQFAAVGHVAYQAARAAGLGRDLPDEWFLQTVHP